MQFVILANETGKGVLSPKATYISRGNIKSKEKYQFHDTIHSGEWPWREMAAIYKMYVIIKIVTMRL